MMAERCVLVTAAVIVRGPAVLIGQRRPGTRHPGKWEFPGGKVEPGEDLIACMRRELQEELSIDATVGRALWQTRHQYAGRDPIELTFFLVRLYAGTPTNRVFAAIEWVPVAELGSVDFLDADRDFISALIHGDVRLD